MFEWLDEEIARIKTNRFHIVDGPADETLREAVETSPIHTPPSFQKFVLRFGNAKLYRRQNAWQVKIFAGPRLVDGEEGESLVWFGRKGVSLAYFKEDLLEQGKESPVFEWRHIGGLRKTADGFQEWFEMTCRRAREKYSKREWKAIEAGPPPFSETELRMLGARAKFHARQVGVSENGDVRIEVHNGSDVGLRFLTVYVEGRLREGLRGLDGDSVGGNIRIDVSGIGPGETKVVECDCYKESAVPGSVEITNLPAPGPEDRGVYWEFAELIDDQRGA